MIGRESAAAGGMWRRKEVCGSRCSPTNFWWHWHPSTHLMQSSMRRS